MSQTVWPKAGFAERNEGFRPFFPRQSAGIDLVPTGSAQKEIWELLHQNIHLKMEVAGPGGLVQEDSPEVTE